MSLGDVLVAIGAALGAAAFVWEAWSHISDRRREQERRQYADDLRVVLVQAQSALAVMRFQPRPKVWTQKHLRPLEDELLAVAERMPKEGPAKRVRRARIERIASGIGLVDSYAAVEGLPVTNESAMRASKQVEKANELHARVLECLKQV